MKKTSVYMTTALLILCACTLERKNVISQAEWLVGTWKQETSKGSLYEIWSKTGKNELTGKSYMLKGKDTIVFEIIRLVQDDGRLFYIPSVKDQNNGSPIRFQDRIISETQLVFENNTHDFPQVIFYTKISKDSLRAEISGINNGKEERRHFPMHRILQEK